MCKTCSRSGQIDLNKNRHTAYSLRAIAKENDAADKVAKQAAGDTS